MVVALLVYTSLEGSPWVHQGLHVLIEGSGAFIALFIAVVIKLLFRSGRLRGSMLWFSSALAVMALITAFHSTMEVNSTFIWLYSCSTMLGGLLLIGMLLPEGEQTPLYFRLMPLLAAGIALIIGSSAMIWPALAPQMILDNSLTPLAMGMNLVGGTGFFIIWLHLLSTVENAPYQERLLLGNFTLLMGISAILYTLSTPWGALWWLVHLLRLLAFALILLHFFRLYTADFRLMRENDSRFHALVESINAAVYRCEATADRRLVYASNAMTRVTGYSMEEMTAEGAFSLQRIIHEEDLEQVEEAINGSLKSGQPYRVQYRIRHKEGKLVWINDRAQPVQNPMGGGVWFDGAVCDVTESQEREQQLELAKRVILTVSEAIVITDAQGSILDVNPSFERITGYMRQEVLGKDPGVTKSGRHDVAFYKKMWDQLIEEGYWQGEIWDRRKNGEVFPKWLTINAIRDKRREVTHYVGVFTDISREKSTEAQLERLAFYDPLTQLPNRVLFRDRLSHEIGLSERAGKILVLLLIDLDRFKIINDTLGHGVGDGLLVQVSNRLVACVRKSDTVARLGGDEFGIILPGVEKPEDAAIVAETIISQLQMPFVLEGNEAFIGGSIGIAIHPQDGENYETLTMNADAAMYKAKESGKGNYKFFTPDMNDQNAHRLQLEADLRRAIDGNELEVYYQPKMDAQSGQIMGMEALVRWNHPERGLVSPGDFIPLAEETGLIVALGEYVLTQACLCVRSWWDEGLPKLRVAVNLSARQFDEENMIEKVQEVLQSTGLPPQGLELEITESIAMHDVERAIEKVRGLRELGVRISIDDFGTGYSSLSYLKQFPLHALKIDRSFVQDMQDEDDATIVSSIISLAKSMHLGVVAEGVENTEQLDFLKGRDCNQVQGFFFSKPLAAEAFRQLLVSKNCAAE
uniref:Putative Diguanylate cyclase/phosphodiesterase with PAS/PAC sensors n=1 Tax=Magnetococcus massalia (strain MO-1) TaxID=451514 RepID=A0A1S7LLX3_MAGMO|nr:putative Diguanylate cyclase/phosphodiesterase with PAS/PAC sensors [Candidatus Magnetococcus massalia]